MTFGLNHRFVECWSVHVRPTAAKCITYYCHKLRVGDSHHPLIINKGLIDQQTFSNVNILRSHLAQRERWNVIWLKVFLTTGTRLLPSLTAEDLNEHRAANNGATERKAGWKENKVMHVGVWAGWRSCRWRLSLAAVWHATRTNATFACAKEVVCWWAVVRPPLLSVCGQPVSDLFKCSWKLLTHSLFLRLTACFLKSVSFLQAPVCLWDAGRGQKKVRQSQLCDTVSALNVCTSISILWLHLDRAKFRVRWLVLKVTQDIFRMRHMQTFTRHPRFREHLSNLCCSWMFIHFECRKMNTPLSYRFVI